MALNTMFQKLNEARKNYEKELDELGEKAVAELLSPHIPAGFALHWTQYTDYFNDGEACTFSVHEPHLSRVDEDDEDDEDDEWTPGRYDGDISVESADRYVGSGKWDTALVDGVSVEQVHALAAAWDELEEDMLFKIFDDHAMIIVYSDGRVRREDCSDHD